MQSVSNPDQVVPLLAGDFPPATAISSNGPTREEELYRRAISGAGAVPYAYDFVNRCYGFMGAGIEDLIGYKPEEVTPEMWIKIIKDSVMMGDTAGLSKEEAAKRIRCGEIKQWRCDMRIVTRAGKHRWISDASVQNMDESGKPIGSVGILQDITERKMSEISAKAFSKLGQDLFSATTLEAAARMIVDVADKLFGWDGCNLYLYVPDADEIYLLYEADLINGKRQEVFVPNVRQKVSKTGRRVLQNGAELVLRDGVTMDPDCIPYGDKGRPSASIMRVPLRQRGKSTGVLAIHSYTQQAYNKHDLNFLQTLADYCSAAFERIWAEESMRNLHRQLLETSRQAGMAEVATSVLHNVGNVLNSVNVSASLVGEKIRKSRVGNLSRAMGMMEAHKTDLADFLTNDAKGRELVGYLVSLSTHLVEEQTQILTEVASLVRDVDHIKEIVAMQQNYARVAGVVEQLNVIDLVDDAIRLNAGAIDRHHVQLTRDYEEAVPANIDKHKVLQILVNLIRNAKYAVDNNPLHDKKMTVRVRSVEGRVQVSIIDNGVGIPPENLTRIFEHGFTTRKDGHGFGLHSGALSAKEMGGSLTVHSDGPGKGAAFTLDFPAQQVTAT